MKKCLLGALALALASTACQPPAQEAGPLSEEDVAAIRAETQEYVETTLARDWDRWVKFYTEDAVFMLPNQPALVGREAILQWAQTSALSELTLTPLEIDGRGDLAYIKGTYSLEMTIEGLPEPISDRGKYVVILRRQPDGSWPAVVDIINSDLPLPEEGTETET
jgi:ketosteroid isomerase-like protein